MNALQLSQSSKERSNVTCSRISCFILQLGYFLADIVASYLCVLLFCLHGCNKYLGRHGLRCCCWMTQSGWRAELAVVRVRGDESLLCRSEEKTNLHAAMLRFMLSRIRDTTSRQNCSFAYVMMQPCLHHAEISSTYSAHNFSEQTLYNNITPQLQQ